MISYHSYYDTDAGMKLQRISHFNVPINESVLTLLDTKIAILIKLCQCNLLHV